MKVHPVQPQTLSTTPQGVLRLSSPQSTATSATTTTTTPKPALPPKPAAPVKPTPTPPPPPRQTQLIAPFAADSPPSAAAAVEIASDVVDANGNKGVISLSVR